MLLAGLGLCLGFPVETCDGKSAGLAPAQCNAWIDLFDAANGDDWFDCERTRTDPCSCNVGTESNSVCDEAFTVIANLVLPFNNMVGSLPASLSALVNVTMLELRGAAAEAHDVYHHDAKSKSALTSNVDRVEAACMTTVDSPKDLHKISGTFCPG